MMNSGMEAMDQMDDGDLDDEAAQEAAFQKLFAQDMAMQFRQRQREVQCAVNLAATLDSALEDTDSVNLEGEWKERMEAEADELTQNGTNPVGATLLKVIGYVYLEESQKMLGFKHSVGAGLGVNSWRRRGHDMANRFRVVKAAYKTYKSAGAEASEQMKREEDAEMKRAKELSKATFAAEHGGALPNDAKDNEENGDGGGSEEKKEDLPGADAMMGMIETMWNLSVIDIEGTLRKACHKIDKDSSVSKEQRVLRAKALCELGRIFDAKGVEAKQGLKAIGEQLAEQAGIARNIQEHRMKEEAANASMD